MSKRILFSAVGNTDPVRGFHEGSLLHIIRHYKPEEVHLYISDEFKKYQESKLYEECIKLYDENIVLYSYPKLEDEHIKDVQKFDYFYKAFIEIIENIKDVHGDEEIEILLNTSSGTPAMKSTMMLLAVTFQELKLKGIQVKTPVNSSNKDVQPESIDNKTAKELVENTFEYLEPDKAENRCSEEEFVKTQKLFLYNNTKKMLKKYDYSGLNDLMEEHKEMFNSDLYNLIKHVYFRYTGIGKEAESFSKLIDLKLYPVENIIEKMLIEKFNTAKIKMRRGEYQDWLLLTNIIIEHIYMEILTQDGMKVYELIYPETSSNKR